MEAISVRVAEFQGMMKAAVASKDRIQQQEIADQLDAERKALDELTTYWMEAHKAFPATPAAQPVPVSDGGE